MTEPSPSALWASLPLPALLVGPDNRIAEVNPAAETFLNLSSRSLLGHPVLDRLSIDAPMDDAFARARAFLSYLPPSVGKHAARTACDDPIDRRDDMLLSVVPREDKQVYSMRAVMNAVLDQASVFEMGRRWGRAAITAFAASSECTGFIAMPRSPCSVRARPSRTLATRRGMSIPGRWRAPSTTRRRFPTWPVAMAMMIHLPDTLRRSASAL